MAGLKELAEGFIACQIATSPRIKQCYRFLNEYQIASFAFYQLLAFMRSQLKTLVKCGLRWKGEHGNPAFVISLSGYSNSPAKSFREGIVDLRVNGVAVKVYNPAKTVADCFKYRNKIGLDVAIEAVRDVLRKRKATVDEVIKFARICRVFNVMRPYLEATSLT